MMNRQEAFSWVIPAIFTAHMWIFFPLQDLLLYLLQLVQALRYEALSDEEEKLTENTVDSLLQDSIESQTAESPPTQGKHIQKDANNLQTDWRHTNIYQVILT